MNASQAEMQSSLAQLDQALYNHKQWYDAIIRTLVCRLPSEPRDLDPNAHRLCLFGHWYYHDASEKLRAHPGFVAIESEHRHMHQRASVLLQTLDTRLTVLPADFDAFAHTLERLQLQVHTLKQEMESALYNLDELTGANNRIGMLTRLREQQELVRRNVQACCIVMMDIDHFKNVNDTYGHLTGDRVLAMSARYLMRHLRPYDKLFRYGGEEFLLCLPDTDQATGHEMVERLRQGLATHPAAFDGQDPIQVTMSFGVTQLTANESVEQSIAHADEAMYAAKKAGRNCTRTWDPSMQNMGRSPAA